MELIDSTSDGGFKRLTDEEISRLYEAKPTRSKSLTIVSNSPVYCNYKKD